MSLIQEFKTFALKGNVIDMAVGVIIGGAFGKIVTSLVNDIIMPPIGVLLGNKNFTDLAITLKVAQPEVLNEAGEVVSPAVAEVLWKYGSFLQVCIDFLIIAVSIFAVIKIANKLTSLRNKEEEEAAAAAAPAPEPEPEVVEPEPSKEEILLTEIRDLLKNK
ncbi:MAG: large-conductance mechanosensitive channel protein MscL [Alistipes sp.]|nr:large-conductance mechanosensitive channel protein MscL [Alistipes sp.]MBR5585593.1 large-conductance mechanosensitive channel protein MscL [Alistipes sp.]MBR6545020.1 large-conductance mechanosensitive channel protein MscL [Alistipes sp.]